MKNLIVYFIVVIAVSAKPQTHQFHSQSETGQYSYGYSNDLSSKTETKTLDGITRGNYAYVDPDGHQQRVEYSSDAVNGFRVTSATNLPVAPAVPEPPKLEIPISVEDTPDVAEAKIKHLEALEKIPEPIKDTPEVAAAKENHLAALKLAQSDEVLIKTEVLTPAHFAFIQPVQFRSPVFAYSYHIPGAVISSNAYLAPGLPGAYVTLQTPNAIVPEEKDSVQVEAKEVKDDTKAKSD